MAVTETLLNIQIDCGIQEGLEEDGWVDIRVRCGFEHYLYLLIPLY